MGLPRVENNPFLVTVADNGNVDVVNVKGVKSKEYYFPEFNIFGKVDRRRLYESAMRRWMRRPPEIPYTPTIKKVIERIMINPTAEVHICLYVDRSGSMTDYQMMILSQLSRIFRVMGEENGIKISLMLASYEGGKVDVLMPMMEMDKAGQVILSRIVVKGFEITGGDETSFDAINHGRKYFSGLPQNKDVTPFIIILTDEEARIEDATTGRQEKKDAAVQAAINEGIETIVVHDLRKEFSLDEKGGKRTWRAILDDICYMLKNMEAYGEAGLSDLKWLAANSDVFLFRAAALRVLQPKLSLSEAVRIVYLDPTFQKLLRSKFFYNKAPDGNVDIMDSVDAVSQWAGLAVLKEIGTEDAMANLLYIALHAMGHGYLTSGEFLSKWGLSDSVVLDAVMGQKEFMGVAEGMYQLFSSPSPETINEIIKKIAAKIDTNFAEGILWYSAFFYISELRGAGVIIDKIRAREKVLADELIAKSGGAGDIFETMVGKGILKKEEIINLFNKLLAGGLKNNTSYLITLLLSIPYDEREKHFSQALKSAESIDERESFRVAYFNRLGNQMEILRQLIWYFEKMAKRDAAYEAGDMPDYLPYFTGLMASIKLGVEEGKEKEALDVIIDGLRKGEETSIAPIRRVLETQVLLPGQYVYMIYNLNGNEGEANGVAIDVMYMFYQNHHKEFIDFALREIRGGKLSDLGKERLFSVAMKENELVVRSDDLGFFLVLAGDRSIDKDVRMKIFFHLPDRLEKGDRRRVRDALRKMAKDKTDPLHQLILNALKKLLGNMTV